MNKASKNLLLNIIENPIKTKVLLVASIICVLILCAFLIYAIWSWALERTETEAQRLAEVAESGFDHDKIKELQADQNDLESPSYIAVRHSLREVVAAHKDIHFAYIFKMTNDKIFFAADSEPVTSEEYSPPGQEYTEAKPEDKQPFYDGKISIIHSTDRWGTWVSVLVPMKDDETGEVIAVFGIDYEPDMWYQYAFDAAGWASMAGVLIILLYIAALSVLRTNLMIRREKAKLSEVNEQLAENVRSHAMLLSNLQGMAYRCKNDEHWTMLYVSDGCIELTGYPPSSLINNSERSFNELISLKYREALWSKWKKCLIHKSNFVAEYEIITAAGETKWVFDQAQAIYNADGKAEALEGLIVDISDRKRKEDEIVYLNYHDFLTGIYNRRYLEMSKECLDKEDFLPLSVIIGDINGLKLVNDVLGHAEGDVLIVETARIIQSCCRKSDIAARVGGDEFTILMPFTDKEDACGIMKKTRQKFEEYNRSLSSEAYSLNVSLGYATKESADESLDMIFKLAEDAMYKRKLLERKSSHSVILSSITATMYEKSHETQEHSERLTHMAIEIGKRMKLTQQNLDELELVSTLHDIGKVAVDARILNKPASLDEAEWVEMKKHSEIGYRIAMSSPDLISVADYVLSLHEHWDGRGYPQGLKEEEIPLISRIVSIVDAFDALTEDRAYRKAMSWEGAVDIIRKNAGTQFDPKIVKIFLEKVLPEELEYKYE